MYSENNLDVGLSKLDPDAIREFTLWSPQVSKALKDPKAGSRAVPTKHQPPRAGKSRRKKLPSIISSSGSSVFSAGESFSSASSIYINRSSIVDRLGDYRMFLNLKTPGPCPSFSDIPVYPSIFQDPPFWLHELYNMEATGKLRIKSLSYGLPCEFDYLGCSLRFKPGDFELKISHSIFHFLGLKLPTRVGCTFCLYGTTVFESRKNPLANWRERMLHVGNHFQRGISEDFTHQDSLVHDYMSKNGVIAIEREFQPPSGSGDDGLLPLENHVFDIGKSSKLRHSEDKEVSNHDNSTHTQDIALPQGDCQYPIFGDGGVETLCGCMLFQEDMLRPFFCDCGHRSDFHEIQKYHPLPCLDAEEKLCGLMEKHNLTKFSVAHKGKAREESSGEDSVDEAALEQRSRRQSSIHSSQSSVGLKSDI